MALSRRTGQRFQGSIWPGFVDAMTGLLLVLMFVLTIFMMVQFVLRETISGQENQLDDLADEVGGLASALGLEERENTQLQARLGALNSTLNTTQTLLTQTQLQLADRTRILADVTAERDIQASELEIAQGRITAFEAQVAALITSRDDAERQISALTGERDDLAAGQIELLSAQDALNLALATAREEIDAQTEAARLDAAKREALSALVADLESEGAKQSAQISELQEQLSEEETSRLVEAVAAKALQERLANADAELTAMTLGLEAQRQEAEDTLTLLAAAESARAQIDAQLEDALSALETARAQAQERDVLAERLTRVLAQMDVSQSEAAARVSALEAELDRVRATSTESQENLQAALSAAQAEALRIQQELERQVSQQQAASVQTQSAFDTQISALREERDAAALAYEQALAEAEARASALDDRLRAEIADAEREFASEKAGLEVQLAQVQTDLQAARRSTLSTEDQRAEVEARLLMALEKLEEANAVAQDKDLLQSRLLAALDRQETAESAEADSRTLAEQRAALLDQARNALSQEQEVSSEAQRQTALLNQQVAALREQLGGLQALLDDYEARDVAQSVQLQSLGQDLNSALARAASEERKRRLLEEAERKRLEDEAAALALKAEALEAESEDLARYRSEFFGRLRDVLGNQDGVRIQGDRFVFASEVLFDVGSADLSAEGEAEIAKVARILQSVAAAIPTELNWIIRVDGHTDNDPLINHPKFADNWELSQGRALSVVRFMVEGLGLPPERLAANGFGEYQPVNPADTAEARAQNRRIELKFTER